MARLDITFGGLDRIESILRAISERLNLMATQEDLAAAVASINTSVDALAAAATGIQGDLDVLVAAQAGGQPLDLGPLQASVAALASQAQGLTAIDAENPAPAPVTPPVV